MTNAEYKLIIDALKEQTKQLLAMPPDKLKERIIRLHGPIVRELYGEEADKMLILLKLIGHYADTTNQRTSTYFYRHNKTEYRVTYGITEEPLIEEVSKDD